MTNEKKLSIFALGGVFEIGKNMYVVQYGDDIVVIDCGSKFPDENLLGIDLIIPDITYLLENKDRIRGMVITHGHEDHIGAIPYILKQINVPVFATRLTLGLINIKLKEHKLKDTVVLCEIHPDSHLELGSLKLSFFRTYHSIPDCVGVVIDTPDGTVVHTGDFKFDFSPANQQYPDLHAMARVGEKGVTVLLSESTNAEREGFTASEKLVGESIEECFQRASNRVFISTFASNVNRLQQIIDAACNTGRYIALLGRSMVNVVKVASELGYIQMPEGMLIDAREAAELPRERVAVMCTGSQGEPMAALSRLASSTHPLMAIEPGDTVIFASSPIPGNEKNVAAILDHLYLLGANVINSGMHVSGHGSQEELKLMLTLMKPKYFVPIHGEYRMLHRHRQLAESVGVDPERIFIMRNGDVLEVNRKHAYLAGKVPSGHTLVDGSGIGDVGNVVLRDRKHLSEDGILISVITLSSQDNALLFAPDVITRGFVFVKESEELLGDVSRLVEATIEELRETANDWTWSLLKSSVKEAVGKFLFHKTKRRPMILPIIIEV
ncbi:ribonuclease J [Paenibacillus thailandensis]|uniref:Ribonuclease J n=1 Tax=Paenibacillus thailandensis TaxID=393250 RepID=A0ABW5QRJ7_9BACL